MEYLQSGLAVLAAIAAFALVMAMINMTFKAIFSAFAWIGMGFTTAAVALQIVPGLYVADRATDQMVLTGEKVNSKKVDRQREKVRSSIIARTHMFVAYPQETAKITNYMRRD